MGKTMSHADSLRMQDEAASMLMLYKQATAEEAKAGHKTAPSIMPAVERLLRVGHLAGTTTSNPLPLSPRQRWIVDVEAVLRELGMLKAFVLLARLTRTNRSARAFENMAHELRSITRRWWGEANEVVKTKAEVKQLFRVAVPAFMNLLEARGIGRSYYGTAAPRVERIASGVDDEAVRRIEQIGEDIRKAMRRPAPMEDASRLTIAAAKRLRRRRSARDDRPSAAALAS